MREGVVVMMVSEVLHEGRSVVTTNDMRSVTLEGDEALRYEIVHWWDHFKRLLEDVPRCPFCELPMLSFLEDLTEGDGFGHAVAHKACRDDWVMEQQEDLNRRFEEGFDLPVPFLDEPGLD